MSVYNMKLFIFFAEIEAKEACDWLKAAGFPQYAQLYEGNTPFHNWSCFLVFFNFFLPSSISPFSCPLLCGLPQPIFRLQLLCTEMGHGKGLFVAAGTCATFSIFFHLSLSTLATVGKLWRNCEQGGNWGENFVYLRHSPRFPVWFQYFYIVKVSNFAKRSWWTPLFLSFFCSYWFIMHLTTCKDSVCFTILFF